MAAAVLVLGTVSVGATAYMKWSQSLERGLRVTEEQKPVLEENHTAAAVNKSVTDNGVTITAQQTIVDSYYAYLSFKVEETAVEGENGEEYTHITYAEPPGLSGVRMKDGTLYPYLYMGPGSMGYGEENTDLYQVTFAIDRVLDIDQVESLLFRKSAPEEGQNATEDNFYIVSLE